MTVSELIELLKTQRQDLPVRFWDAEEDEWVDVAEAVWESGTSHVALSQTKQNWTEAEPE